MKLKIEKIGIEHEDDRGVIIDILRGDVQHVGLITSKKGSVRANHYHKEQIQYTYVLKGKIKLTTKDMRVDDAEPKTQIVEQGYLISIPPMVAHKYFGEEDYEIIAMTTLKRTMEDYEADTYRVEI